MKTLQGAVYQVHSHRKMLFWAMAGSVGLLSLLYIYLINATVLHVVARERSVQKVTDLTTTVSDLEFTNISLKNLITPEKALAMGFQESDNITFLSSDSQALSYNAR